MEWEQQIEKTARHYAELSQQPGWFQYCKHTIIQMEAMESSPWAGLRKRWGAFLTEAGFKIPPNEKNELLP
jgi:hypothetical protein